MMNSRARVTQTLAHKQPDRVPVDLWSKGGGLTNGAYIRLKEYLGISGDIDAYRPGQTSAYYDERILEVLQIDFRHVFLHPPEVAVAKRIGEDDHINEWGVTMRRSGDTSCPVNPPLSNATIDDLKRFQWPDSSLPGRTTGLKERIDHLWNHTSYAIAYRPVSPIDFGLLEESWGHPIFLLSRGKCEKLKNLLKTKV